MRTLSFIVDGKSITPNPACNFEGLFPGANPEVRAKFLLSPEWKRGLKVVAFRSILGKEYPPTALNEDDTCEIPVEALNTPAFKIQILRKYRNITTITNELTVYQKGGRV